MKTHPDKNLNNEYEIIAQSILNNLKEINFCVIKDAITVVTTFWNIQSYYQMFKFVGPTISSSSGYEQISLVSHKLQHSFQLNRHLNDKVRASMASHYVTNILQKLTQHYSKYLQDKKKEKNRNDFR